MVLLYLKNSMKKGNMSPALVNKTEKMSVPATKGAAYSTRPEGKTEYKRGTAAGDMAANTKGMTPKLTYGK